MANPTIYDGSPGPISGSTPFGFYDNDTDYQNDGPKVANYCARKLGYPVLDVELNDLNIYACFEEAVSVYAEELYQLKIRNINSTYKYSDYSDYQNEQDCYLFPASMYYVVPSDLDRLESTGEERTSFDPDEVDYALWEAF